MDWRAAHRARVEALEAEATSVMLDALGPIMAGVASRFAVAAVTAAGGEEAQARASLDDLSAIDVQWRAAVHDEVLPWFAHVYETGGQAAVEQVLGLGIAVLDVDDALMNHAAATYLQGVENRFYPLGEEAWGKARAELVEGFSEGEGVSALRARIRDVTDLTARQAETLARTEVIAASNMGAQARIDLMGDSAPPYRQWLSTMDNRTRPTHRAADGQVQPRGTAFDVGGSALMVPGDPDGPAREVVNCLVGSTRVQWPGLRAATARRYDGELFRIRFASGDELTGTPNHPILTVAGWRTLGALQVGDDCVRGVLRGELTGQPHEQDPPPEIAEVYELAALAGSPQRVAGAPVDFHGDGAYGHVDVVPVSGSLGVDVQAATPEQVDQFGLTVAHAAAAADRGGDGACFRSWAPGAGWDEGAPPGRVGGLRQCQALGRPESIHTQLLGLTARANRKAKLLEAPDDDRSGDPEVGGHSRHGVALFVAPTQVVEVEVLPGGHEVYNLDTGAGWYIANNLVTGNCRCTVIFTESADPLLAEGRQQGGIVDDVATEPLAAAAVSGPPQVDTTTGEPHTGAMVALVPADPEAWAVAQGEPPEAIHLTLAYLGDGAEIPDATFDALLAQAEQLAADRPPVEANVFGAAVWNMSGPESCLVLSVGGADLEPLHAATWVTVQRAGVANGEAGLWMPPEQHSPWVAHVCLSYQPDPAGTVQQVAQQFEGPITFDRLRVTRGAEAYDFTLAGALPEEDIDMDSADLAAMIDAAFVRHGLTAAVEPGAPASGDPASASAETDDGPPAQPGEHLRAIMHRQGVATGLRDSGRVFTNMTYREPPFAYHSQVNSSAHGGTPRVVPVGLVTRIVETPTADYGFVRLDLDNPDAMEHARRAVAGFDRWVSIGGDETAPKVTLVWPAPGEAADPMLEIDPDSPFEEVLLEPEKVILDGVNVAELTSVSTPAQADAVLEPTAELVAMFADAAPAPAELPAGEVVLATGGLLPPAVAAHVRIGEGCGCGGSCGGCGQDRHVEEVMAGAQAAALTAAAYAITLTDLPPAFWFQEPTDVEITSALSITDEGRLYGLVAPFGTNHRAYAKAGRTQFAPEGNVDYARFMGKWAVAAEGPVPAGPVTMGCGHATMARNSHETAPEYYDNSCSVFGMVAVGESKRLGGVWMAGHVLPGTSAATIARALACTCSGDWQSHPDRSGWQELVAALLVPVPGFAMPHASTSYRGDALVASAVPVMHVATAEADAARLRALTISRLAASVGRTPAARVLAAARRGRT